VQLLTLEDFSAKCVTFARRSAAPLYAISSQVPESGVSPSIAVKPRQSFTALKQAFGSFLCSTASRATVIN